MQYPVASYSMVTGVVPYTDRVISLLISKSFNSLDKTRLVILGMLF